MNDSLRMVSRSAHTSIILTGFLMLREQKRIEFDLIEDVRNPEELPHPHLVEGFFHGKRIAYDLYDGDEDLDSPAFARYVADVACYFKRSYNSNHIRRLDPAIGEKIHPLGLFYRVTYPGNPLYPPKKKTVKQLLLGQKDQSWFTPCRFEADGRENRRPKVMFFTRLWGSVDDLEKAGNREINKMRIASIRILQEHLGDLFLGGVVDSDLSRALCPDLILPGKYTRRDRYLQMVKHTPIVVCSTGLHNSIQGKVAEGVAAGRALVCEKLCYEVPGDFSEGKHYLAFTTPEECLAQVQSLIADEAKRKAMQEANLQYYREYSRPDRMVLHSLMTAGVL